MMIQPQWAALMLAAFMSVTVGDFWHAEVAAQEPSLDGIAWLTGCWRAEGARGATDEQWMRPDAGMMLGMVRRVRDGQVIETERLMIRVVGDAIEYMADPSGQAPTTFTAVSTDGPDWEFVNLDHDFPQRIVYRLRDANSLDAYISGMIDGEERRIDFPQSRVSCDGSP
ncbi:MAG: hypothetical protein HKO77_07775 [Gemmatimonadetes bacterium]|nr:hypothetical protein [Gemmatimonadota bacterium]NNL30906.1 hypothetical protein [Gemmatimonadota bacterium]